MPLTMLACFSFALVLSSLSSLFTQPGPFATRLSLQHATSSDSYNFRFSSLTLVETASRLTINNISQLPKQIDNIPIFSEPMTKSFNNGFSTSSASLSTISISDDLVRVSWIPSRPSRHLLERHLQCPIGLDPVRR